MQTPLQKWKTLFRTKIKILKNSWSNGIQTNSIIKTIYRTQYKIMKLIRKLRQQNQKTKCQIKEQCYIW